MHAASRIPSPAAAPEPPPLPHTHFKRTPMKLRLAAAAFALALTAPAFGQETYNIDPSHSLPGFEVQSLGLFDPTRQLREDGRQGHARSRGEDGHDRRDDRRRLGEHEPGGPRRRAEERALLQCRQVPDDHVQVDGPQVRRRQRRRRRRRAHDARRHPAGDARPWPISACGAIRSTSRYRCVAPR